MVLTLGDRKLYDFDTLKSILKLSKSTLQNELKKLNPNILKYKNMYLYDEVIVLELIENLLNE